MLKAFGQIFKRAKHIHARSTFIHQLDLVNNRIKN